MPPIRHEKLQPAPWRYQGQEHVHITPESQINHHWQRLNGAPGNRVSGVEEVAGGHRIRYDRHHGAIYLNPQRKRAAWVHGRIGERYDAIGGPRSWLGFPTDDEREFDDGGRVSTFERGNIYWWPDVGAVELDQVVVRYTGILCFGETDWDQGSPSDEPYVILGTVAPQGSTTHRSRIYEGVNAIQGRTEIIEIYRGRPYGISLTALFMEHDDDDPDRYKEVIGGAVGLAFKGVTAAVGTVLTPAAAAAVKPLLEEVAPVVTDALNKLLDLKDDDRGQQTLTLSAKQMVVLAARNPEAVDYGVPWKLQTPLFNGDGSSYKVCFSLAPA